jgi:DNA-binding transcriptional LysR family regulator
LSTQIQALERELGVQLFARSTRRVVLTMAGENSYDRSVRILSDIDVSAEVTRSIAGKTARKIRIGTTYPAIGVLSAFLSKIARKYPDIQLQVQSGSTGDIIRNLESGQINLDFIRPVENIGSLPLFSMANDEYLLAVARDSRLAARTCPTPRAPSQRCSPSMIWPATSAIAATTRLRWSRWCRPVLASALRRKGRRISPTAIFSFAR